MTVMLLGAVRLLLAVQSAQAVVTGSVRDLGSGEPLAGAVVTLADVERSVISDANGRYTFTAVPAGPHHLTVRRIGYSPRALHALVPARGELHISITLAAVPVRVRGVEIRPPVAIRGADQDGHAAPAERGISAAALRNHPMLAEMDAFLALGGAGVVMRSETPTGVHLRGGASDQTAFVLDGIPVFSPYHAGGTFSAWNPDALEELRVSSSRAAPDALSGAITGVTRAPGPQVRVRGSTSSTQARATIDGPLGIAGAGFLLSVRSGFLGIVDPKRESSYLKGETGDVLAKIELAMLAGRLRLLAYDSQNEISAAAHTSDAPPDAALGDRNEFAWHSQSLGGEWTRTAGALTVRLAGWSAISDAGAIWQPDESPAMHLSAGRKDIGLRASGDWRSARSVTTGGVHLQQSRTIYDVASTSSATPLLSLLGRTPVTTVFIEHERSLGSMLAATLSLSGAMASGRVHPEPRAELRWAAAPRLTVSGSYDRSHQFSQSLRNSESVVGSVFPVDLYIGAGARGVPVARGDRGVLAADYQLRDGVRLGTQLYARDFRGLLLVAPRTGDPFADHDFATGSGTARGFSFEAAANSARYGVVTSYGWQRLRLEHDGSRYVPEYGTSHLVEMGAIVFLSPTASMQLGATGEAGRRATPVSRAFEWEACNVLDDGCELGGSPHHDADRLGTTHLPAYLRLDLGFRKHWDTRVAGRDAQIGLFGTVTNVLGRQNVFAIAPATSTVGPAAMEMRPRTPLVVGLDWRF